MNPLHSIQLSLALLLSCSLKMSFLLGLAWVITRVARRRSAAFRHFVWSLGILGSLMLPLLSLLLPAWPSITLSNAPQLFTLPHGTAASQSSGTLISMIVNAGTAPRLVSNLNIWLLLVWAAGFLFVSMRLLTGIGRLLWLSARAKPLAEKEWTSTIRDISRRFMIARPVRVLQCDDPAVMPVAWGIFRPSILLPAIARQWPEYRTRIVMCHELAHIARADCLLQICAEMARAFYWFHPFAWKAANCLRQESECACDDAVLNCEIDPSEYAKQLIDVARTLKNPSSVWSAALAFARPSNLERRFTFMLNPSTNRDHVSPRARLLTVLSALCLLIPLAALDLRAQGLPGQFTGTVYDPSGSPVANATVIMTNHSTNKVEMTTSGGDGIFKFEALSAGEYEMKVEKPGFEEYKASPIILEAGRESSQNMTLKVGSVTEELDVVAGEMARSSAAPIHVRGDIQAPRLLNKVQPLYPVAAKAAGVQGTVILHAIIGIEGNLLSLRVMNSQVDPDLARAAVEAVSKWRYSPTLLNGEPIEVDTTIKVNFMLSS